MDYRFPRPPRLNPGQLQIWQVNWHSWEAKVPDLKMLLSPGEMLRAERYQVQEKGNQFIVSTGLLRLILGAYLNTDPLQVQIHTTPAGKPYLPDRQLFFNLSHSDQRIIYGFSQSGQLGIDIQKIYPISNLSRIVENYFHPLEREYLQTTDPERRLEQFFNLWTVKEAYLKALGNGFRLSSRDFSVLPDNAAPGKFTLDHPDQGASDHTWLLRSLSCGTGYKASTAAAGRICTLQRIPLLSFPEDI